MTERSSGAATSPAEEQSLDPDDWEAARRVAYEVVDLAIDRLAKIRNQPVWLAMPERVRESYAGGLPEESAPLSAIVAEIRSDLLPYAMGNIHPRFWMWYMGAGTFTGALGEFLAAVDGSNLGGGNCAAARLDQQVIAWIMTMIGFPPSASGTLVDGGSMANIIGLTVARDAKAGTDVREFGIRSLSRPLRFYCSDQVHSAHEKAMVLLGLGRQALRRIPTGADLRLDMKALLSAIAEDRAAGWQPACLIATAGTTNSGAIDDLRAAAELCRKEQLWFHVDGCIGALLAIAPRHGHLVDGLSQADSLALDLHKWLQVPFEAGCGLVRDKALHRASFAVHPEYLEEKTRGIASAEFLCDYNLQTTRGFRALKIWMMLKQFGVRKLGEIIDQSIDQARYLGEAIAREPRLVLLAPISINIVCFRYDPGGLAEAALRSLNTEIMLRLQEEGTAAISDTTIGGRHALRVAICNHRSRYEDFDVLVAAVVRLGGVLSAEMAQP
jgi:aromatic-L-amino-acid/L-tryptophan decarboxylase